MVEKVSCGFQVTFALVKEQEGEEQEGGEKGGNGGKGGGKKVYVWGKKKSFDSFTTSHPSPHPGLIDLSSFHAYECPSLRGTFIFAIKQEGEGVVAGVNVFNVANIPLKKGKPVGVKFMGEDGGEGGVVGGGEVVVCGGGGGGGVMGVVVSDVFLLFVGGKRFVVCVSVCPTVKDVVEFLYSRGVGRKGEGGGGEGEGKEELFVFDCFGERLEGERGTGEVVQKMREMMGKPALFAIEKRVVVEKEGGGEKGGARGLIIDGGKGVMSWGGKEELVRLLFSGGGGGLCRPMENPQLKGDAVPSREYKYKDIFMCCFASKYIGISPQFLLDSLIGFFDNHEGLFFIIFYLFL